MSHAGALLQILERHEARETRRRARYERERATLRRTSELMEELSAMILLADEAVTRAKVVRQLSRRQRS